MAHGLKLHTFCVHLFGSRAIWSRDIDKSADERVIHNLATKTNTPLERVRETTLASYCDTLFEEYKLYGATKWVLPVGVYHRKRTLFGLQYCPQCLAEDSEPYFRRKWRLAFVCVCEKHQIILRDCCSKCEAPINFHRNELGDHRKAVADSLTHCYHCRHDLAKTFEEQNSQPFPVTQIEVDFTNKLLQGLTDGFIRVGETVTVYSHLYFAVLRQLMKIVRMRRTCIESLRQTIAANDESTIYLPSVTNKSTTDLQELRVAERRCLLGLARYLMTDYPERFLRLARQHKIWSSIWLRHLEPKQGQRQPNIAPFWFWQIVHNNLYHPRHQPSRQEIEGAIKYIRRSGGTLNKSVLARLLGVAAIRYPIIP
ncbi:MAG: TniQ family protein [Pyrinomonadaceae bacterium MAG19_C2-C3]|nr:TniQ family protein [Pyrinomonadaceae bacterium MAG19_C2-C3]